MLRPSRNKLAVLVGAAALVAIGATPAAAAPVQCPGTRVPAFETPDVTLTPEPNTSMTIWSSSVTVLAFCEDLSNPTDFSVPLSGVNISDVELFNTNGIQDLTLSISVDGTGPFVATPPGETTIPTTGIQSDASGNATFIMRASSKSTPFLGGPDGAAQLIGMQFDVNLPTSGSTTFVLPDEGLVFAQTPELDSIVLFGGGAFGLASYALMRMRARRRD